MSQTKSIPSCCAGPPSTDKVGGDKNPFPDDNRRPNRSSAALGPIRGLAATHCPVEATITLIGGKYKALILWKLAGQTLRFSELRKEVPKATPKMLTQQLRELENDGLIQREVFPVVPPKVEYSMTPLGRSITPVLEAMYAWGTGLLHLRGHEVNCSMTPLDSDDRDDREPL